MDELGPGQKQEPREIDVAPETKEWITGIVGELQDHYGDYLALADQETGFSVASILGADLITELPQDRQRALITALRSSPVIVNGNLTMRVDEEEGNVTDIVFAQGSRAEAAEAAQPEEVAQVELPETTDKLRDTAINTAEETLRNVRSLEIIPRHPYGGAKQFSEQTEQERAALNNSLQQTGLSTELQASLLKYLVDPDSGFWASDMLKSFPDLPQQARESLFTALTKSEAVKSNRLVVWAYLDGQGNMLNIVLKPPDSPAKWKMSKTRTVLTLTALVDAPPEERGKCEVCGQDVIILAPVPGGKPRVEDCDYPEFVPCPNKCLSTRTNTPLKYQTTYRPEAKQ